MCLLHDMGVLDPIRDFDEGVPATPPGLEDIQEEDNSEDDLFSDSVVTKQPQVFNFKNDLSFKDIIPVLPAKGEFILEDLKKTQPEPEKKKKKKFCSRCFEEVKKDLKKLAKVIEGYRKERDDAINENEKLKKEVADLKKQLKEKNDNEKGTVKLSVTNKTGNGFDVFLQKKNLENAKNSKVSNDFTGLQTVSINLAEPKDSSPVSIEPIAEPKQKKTVAELRREFFQDFKSEQKTFTSRSYLEIKPQEDVEIFRSKLNIRVKPRKSVNEAVSLLASNFEDLAIPEMPKINLFQRFEKTRIVWEDRVESRVSY